jgi:hypothetical protein
MSTPPKSTSKAASKGYPVAPVRQRKRPASDRANRTAYSAQDQASDPKHSDYEVGYRKPPKHTRFKPGRSGNPKGRPKAAKGLNTLVRQTLTQKVAVRTASGHLKMSRIEAVLQKTAELAMKGNLRALVELLKLYGNAVPDTSEDLAKQESQDELTATDLAILDELRCQLASEAEKKP